MADKIKKFFAKKKSDSKFRAAGPGHRLNAGGGSSSNTLSNNSRSSPGKSHNPPSRSAPSAEACLAAQAALARLGEKREKSAAFNTSLAAIQAQVKREMEAEKNKSSLDKSKSQSRKSSLEELDSSPHLATHGVYFRCPFINDEILPKNEWKSKIKTFLYEQLADERGLTACLMIHSCNTREKVGPCVEALTRYLENLLNFPGDPKFTKIRMSNPAFAERVKPVEGALDYLIAAGFREEVMEGQNGPEPFLVYNTEHMENSDSLKILLDAIRTAEPIALELDRGLQVLLPSQAHRQTELPPDFYAISPEEIKREQQLRNETIEKAQMLRTKAMREKEELRELKKYKFALIRVRFPDGVFLQGTFGVYEKASEIFDFVRNALHDEDEPFHLSTIASSRLDESTLDKSIIELKLVPATVLTFTFVNFKETNLYLKPELMLLVQEL